MTKEEQKQRLQHFLRLRLDAEEGSINRIMNMRLYAWDEHSITLVFPVEEWQLNPMGNMHGGMLATAVDITMGGASYTFSEAQHTPTVTMNVQYVRPVFPKKDLYIKAVVDHSGSRITQIRAWGWQEEGNTCITASGSYIVNTCV